MDEWDTDAVATVEELLDQLLNAERDGALDGLPGHLAGDD